MARTVNDARLETRAARARLKPQGKPYWRAIEPGLHLGYRRPQAGSGKWVVRHYAGGQTYTTDTIATADDLSDADGVAVLSFKDAQDAARDRMVKQAHTAAGHTGPLTVADVMDRYFAHLDADGRSATNVQRARYHDQAFIRPALGKIEATELTAERLKKWLADLAKMPARVRTPRGEKQRYQSAPVDDDARRARRASANRTRRVLMAALNLAFKDGKISNADAWRRVTPFKNVEAARVRYLTLAESQRLINASDPEIRPLVQAALMTGCRYGELCNLQVADLDARAGTLNIRRSKSGKARHVILTPEAVAFFRQHTAGRDSTDLIFRRVSGGPWRKANQQQPMIEASARARIRPAVNFHALRHTYASALATKGVPMAVIAAQLGHRDTRMCERFYAHLAPSHVADVIRANAPRYGIETTNIRPLRS
jgi:integrase